MKEITYLIFVILFLNSCTSNNQVIDTINENKTVLKSTNSEDLRRCNALYTYRVTYIREITEEEKRIVRNLFIDEEGECWMLESEITDIWKINDFFARCKGCVKIQTNDDGDIENVGIANRFILEISRIME